MAGVALQLGGCESAFFAAASYTADGAKVYAPGKDGKFVGDTVGLIAGFSFNLISAIITVTATTIVRGDGVSWLSAAGGGMTNQAQKITVLGLRGGTVTAGKVLAVTGVTATTITFTAQSVTADATALNDQVTINVLGSSCQFNTIVCIESVELVAIPTTNALTLQFCTPDGTDIPGLLVTFPTTSTLPLNYPVSGNGGHQVNGRVAVGSVLVGGWAVKIGGTTTVGAFRVNHRRVE